MNYFSALRQKLSEHFFWHKSRIELLSMIIFSLFTIKNISLPKLALGIETTAKPDSIVKRIYRFLSLQTIEELSFARFVLSLLNLKKFVLIIDRTNWEFGKAKLNILYLAISYNNIAIPVLLKMLDNSGGSSSTEDRIGLLEKFLKISNPSQIEALLGDREFFSEEWIKFLTINKIKPIKIKKHGRRLFSIFTYGLNIMHKILLSKIDRPKLRQLISSILDKQTIPPHLQQFTVLY